MADILRVRDGIIWRGIAAIKGVKGDTGERGPAGPQGPAGIGVPAGGSTNDILKKKSNTDYDYKWEPESARVTYWGSVLGNLQDQIDLTAALNGKQASLISGTNIKTINNESILTSGNIDTTFATWLHITGNLSDNTALTTALNAKADNTDVEAIEAVIPTQATSSNQLADKNFVNSSIATNTANYISDNGQPFTSVAALEAYSGTVTNNDYAFVTGLDEQGNTYFDRYKATVTTNTITWAKEYRLNNSSFTASQWAAISSGITSSLVTAFENKYDKPASGIPKTDLASAVQTSLGKADTALQEHQSLSAYRISADQDIIDNTKYVKPATGVPKTDMASDVQTSLGKADTALQEHQSLASYRTSADQDTIDSAMANDIDDLETLTSGHTTSIDNLNTSVSSLDTNKQSKGLSSTDVVVSAFTQQETPEYEDFPFVADITISGVTSSDYAMVTFDVADAMSGEYAPVCKTDTDSVRIYKASDLESETTLTIPSIVVVKG